MMNRVWKRNQYFQRRPTAPATGETIVTVLWKLGESQDDGDNNKDAVSAMDDTPTTDGCKYITSPSEHFTYLKPVI